MGFRASCFGFRVWDLELRFGVWGLGRLRVWGLESGVKVLGFGFWTSCFRDWSLGFGAWGFWV